jgi:hypothetical protein
MTTATEEVSVIEGLDSMPAKNSQLFRLVNEEIRSLSTATIDDYDFVCECNDCACAKVMRMNAQEYEGMLGDPTLFATVPGHEQKGPQDVIGRNERFVLLRRRTGRN